jgi:restriction system protein
MGWFRSNTRGQPGSQIGLDGIRAMRWPEFEELMVEAFRQRGYSVEKTGHGGLDGDIDLILRKESRTELVQCKLWKTRQMHIATVREVWGLVAHHGANAVKIVCAGSFDFDAGQFARDKAIDLIDGERLLQLVGGVRATSSTGGADLPAAALEPAVPDCPTCSAAMFKRFNRQTNQMFWSCTKYPACKGTRPI